MAKLRTYPKGKRVCIFCEGKSGARLSHEHIFPDWLRDIFHRSPTDSHTHGVMSWADDDFGAPPIVTLLMDTLAPPPKGWWIWIAGSQGLEWSAGINHFGAHADFGPADPKTRNNLNLQSTTIGLGALLAFCISTTSPLFQGFALSHPDRSQLQPIWPITDSDITWPPRRLLRDDEINVIATNLSRAKAFSGS